MRLIASLAGAFVTLALGGGLLYCLWEWREMLFPYVIGVGALGVIGAAWRVAQSTWRGERVKFWWMD